MGDGPLRAEVETAIAAQGLLGRIHLTGLRRDVPDLMHSFDVFALSSLWEGLPHVLLSDDASIAAMTAGLPIVATAVDGNAEAVEHGLNGFLTPPGDPQAFATTLLELLTDPELAAKMGWARQAALRHGSGRNRVEEFSARKMVRDIAALYEELLAQKKTHSH